MPSINENKTEPAAPSTQNSQEVYHVCASKEERMEELNEISSSRDQGRTIRVPSRQNGAAKMPPASTVPVRRKNYHPPKRKEWRSPAAIERKRQREMKRRIDFNAAIGSLSVSLYRIKPALKSGLTAPLPATEKVDNKDGCNDDTMITGKADLLFCATEELARLYAENEKNKVLIEELCSNRSNETEALGGRNAHSKEAKTERTKTGPQPGQKHNDCPKSHPDGKPPEEYVQNDATTDKSHEFKAISERENSPVSKKLSSEQRSDKVESTITSKSNQSNGRDLLSKRHNVPRQLCGEGRGNRELVDPSIASKPVAPTEHEQESSPKKRSKRGKLKKCDNRKRSELLEDDSLAPKHSKTRQRDSKIVKTFQEGSKFPPVAVKRSRGQTEAQDDSSMTTQEATAKNANNRGYLKREEKRPKKSNSSSLISTPREAADRPTRIGDILPRSTPGGSSIYSALRQATLQSLGYNNAVAAENSNTAGSVVHPSQLAFLLQRPAHPPPLVVATFQVPTFISAEAIQTFQLGSTIPFVVGTPQNHEPGGEDQESPVAHLPTETNCATRQRSPIKKILLRRGV